MAFNIILLVAVTAVLQVSVQTEIIKCLLNDKHMEIEQTCVKKITGSTDPDTAAKAKENKETKAKIEECAFTSMEIISGNEFHADKFEKVVNEVGANDEAKSQLMAIMKDCLTKHDKTKSKEIIGCIVTGAEKVCTPKINGGSDEGKQKKLGLTSSLEGKSSTGSPLMKDI